MVLYVPEQSHDIDPKCYFPLFVLAWSRPYIQTLPRDEWHYFAFDTSAGLRLFYNPSKFLLGYG